MSQVEPSSSKPQRRLLIGVTGASGTVYAQRLAQIALLHFDRVYLLATDAAKQVGQHELKLQSNGFCLRSAIESKPYDCEHQAKIRVLNNNDLFAPVASGSSVPTSMVVIPCSMGTLSRLATGNSANLLERAADVMLKQKKQLIIAPRETPIHQIHLENMLKLSQAGVQILPLMPAFYQKPKTIEDMVDFMAGRVLEQLGCPHELYPPWNSRMI